MSVSMRLLCMIHTKYLLTNYLPMDGALFRVQGSGGCDSLVLLVLWVFGSRFLVRDLVS